MGSTTCSHQHPGGHRPGQNHGACQHPAALPVTTPREKPAPRGTSLCFSVLFCYLCHLLQPHALALPEFWILRPRARAASRISLQGEGVRFGCRSVCLQLIFTAVQFVLGKICFSPLRPPAIPKLFSLQLGLLFPSILHTLVLLNQPPTPYARRAALLRALSARPTQDSTRYR